MFFFAQLYSKAPHRSAYDPHTVNLVHADPAVRRVFARSCEVWLERRGFESSPLPPPQLLIACPAFNFSCLNVRWNLNLWVISQKRIRLMPTDGGGGGGGDGGRAGKQNRRGEKGACRRLAEVSTVAAVVYHCIGAAQHALEEEGPWLETVPFPGAEVGPSPLFLIFFPSMCFF